MQIKELIESLTKLQVKYGVDTECVIGCGFGDDGRLETVSLQAEPYGEENEVVFEEDYCGDECFLKDEYFLKSDEEK